MAAKIRTSYLRFLRDLTGIKFQGRIMRPKAIQGRLKKSFFLLDFRGQINSLVKSLIPSKKGKITLSHGSLSGPIRSCIWARALRSKRVKNLTANKTPTTLTSQLVIIKIP